MYNFIVFCLIFLSFSPIAGESSIFDWFKTEKVEHISEFIINNRDNTNLVNQYNGLQDLEVLDKLLKDENYKEALKHVWTEPDLEKKIAWLEMKSFENHVVMQYELAVAYRELDQSEHMLAFTIVPWFMTAVARTGIDLACTTDQKAKEFANMLNKFYVRLIAASGALLPKIESEVKTAVYANLNEVLLPFFDTESANLPSPKWIFMPNSDETPISETKWKERREAIARYALSNFAT